VECAEGGEDEEGGDGGDGASKSGVAHPKCERAAGNGESGNGGGAEGMDGAVRVEKVAEPVAAGRGVVTEGEVGGHGRLGAAKRIAPPLP
jgi:hypothetical protein